MRLRWLASLFLSLAVTFTASAGTFPEKPVEAIVPWAAGGGGDLVFRALAAFFQAHSGGQPLLIKNIPGAAGVPGVMEFMKAKPDGYTVIHWNGAQTIKTHMSKTPYTATQFIPVCGVVNDAPYLLVRGDSPFKTIKDFIGYAKANPGKINFGNAGIGGGSHLNQLLFTDAAGIEVATIPFQGGGPLLTGLMSGQVDIVTVGAPEGVSQVQSGQLRVLCVLMDQRIALFPDTPTAKEVGIDVALPQRRAVLVPAGTPQERVDALFKIFQGICTDPGFVKMMKDMGSNIDFIDGPAMAKALQEEDTRFLNLIKGKKLGDVYGAKK